MNELQINYKNEVKWNSIQLRDLFKWKGIQYY